MKRFYFVPAPYLTCEGSWSFDFVANGTLVPNEGPTPTFERSTIGTYFDSNGVMQTAAINTPRFEHMYDGSSWVSKGLLIEPQSTNQYGPSEDFTNAAWIKTGTTIIKNDIAAPDGTVTGNRITETATFDLHTVGQTRPDTNAGSSFSCYLKQGTARYAYLHMYFFGVIGTVWILCVADLQTGTITFHGTSTAGPFSTANYLPFIVNAGNGWYRLCVQTSVKLTFGNMSVGIAQSATPSYNAGNMVPNAHMGSTLNYIYAWGAQFESATCVTSYIKNSSATTTPPTGVTRGADACYIDAATFSALWNTNEGSIFSEYEHYPIHDLGRQYFTGPASVVADPPDGINYVYLLSASESAASGDYSEQLRTNIEIDSSPSPGAFSNIKIAAGLKDNDFAVVVNGGTVQKLLSGTLLNTVGAFYLGPVKLLTDCPPVMISKVRYYPCRLTDNELQTLTV